MLKRFIHAGITSLLAIGMLSLPAITATAGDTNSEDASTSVKKDPYTVVQVTDHQDGSGFGTADAPYVTKEHGYTVGDEGPKDGVVTSGDVAWYKMHVTFLAAKSRTVIIRFADLGDALTATKPTCPTGQFISGWAVNGTCQYEIPTGISESFDLTLNLKANDTGGKTVTVDPKIIVERSGGETSGLKLGRLTVTSVPMMDVYLDKDDSQSGETTAAFAIRTRALCPAGASNMKGFSRLAPYSALLDLTSLPDGVKVIVDEGIPLTPTAGMLKLPEASGDRSVKVTGLPKPNPSEQRNYDVHITVTSSMTGWKGQPGDGLGRDDSTLNADTGARAGVSYPNNDWVMISTIGQTKYIEDPEYGIGDRLHFDRPYTPTQTKWDDGNLKQDSSSLTWFDPIWVENNNFPTYTYGLNTEFTAKAHLNFDGSRNNDCTDDNPCVTFYQWGDGLTMTSLPTATSEDGKTALPDGTYRVLYGTSTYPFDYTKDKTTYRFKELPAKFAADLSDTQPYDPATIHRIVIVRSSSQQNGWLSWGMKATGLGSTKVTGIGTNDIGKIQLMHDATIQVTNPRPSTAGISGDYTVERSKRMNGTTDIKDIEAGDRITGTWEPTVSNPPTTTQPITTSVDVCLPKGLTNATITAAGWTVKETSNEKCASSWHLTYTGKAYVSNRWDGLTSDTGSFDLPKISWKATVQPTAEGTITPGITGTVHMDAWRSLPADTQTISSTINLPVTFYSTNVSIVDTGMKGDTAPVHDPGANDPVTWTVTATEGAPVSVMLALPDPADCNQLMNSGKGPNGDWHEYDRGCSTAKERLTNQPEVDTAMTRGDVSLQYTTGSITSLDPSDYAWQGWDDIKDKTTITGIKATVGSSDNLPALTCINLTLSGMTSEGQADVWAGAPYRDGKALTGVSWPGVVQHRKATITFRLFKDVDEDGVFTASDQTGDNDRNTTVNVYKSDEYGAKGDFTGSQYLGGSYQWKKVMQLSSGWYLLVAHIDGSKANGGMTDTDGRYVYNIGSTNTYYGKPDNTHATTATTKLIHVDAGGSETADFGWTADTPRLSVTQKETLNGCDAGYCKATVTTTLSNDGGTIIPDDTLIHSTLSQGTAKDEWSYSTLVMDGEHTVNGSLLRDTAGHYWYHAEYPTYSLVRLTAFDGFDTVEASHDSIQGYSSSWAVTTDGRVLSASPYPGSTRASAFMLSDSTVKSDIGVFSPPEGRKFIHVRACYGGPCAIAQTDDGALWMYHMTGSSPDYVGSGFTKLDTGDAKFDLTKQPKTFGAQIMLIDSQHRLWTMDNKTDTLSQGGMLWKNDNWVNQDANIKVPFDGGPTRIKDIATLPGDGRVYYTYGTYINDTPVAAVVDADGRLWLCHKHRINSSDSYTVVWDKTNVTGVAQLAGVYDGNSNPFYNAWSSSLKAHTVWYLGEDGGLYRFDPDTMMDGRETYDRAMDTSLLESRSATPSPGKPVRVLPDKTFSKLMVVFTGDDSRMFAAITTAGRLYTWGGYSSDDIADRTPRDTSADAPHQSMTATPDSTDGKTTTYKLPFQLAPGDTVTLTRELTIPRSEKDTIATTQTWADGTLTPYKGITGLDAPTPPDTSSTTPYSGDGRITGNSSCMMEGHVYDITNTFSREDQCEQNGVKVPALDKGTTIITGGISGVAWLDENGDGIHQPSETIRPGVKVRLADKTGATLQTTETTSNGGYSFTGLTPGEYTVWMTESSPKFMWTTQHAGSDTTVDSDINPGLEDYGSATVTLTNDKPNAGHVDGGLTARPTTGTLPHSGRIGIILLVAACLLLLAAGVFRTRGGGYSGRSARVKVVPRHSATA